MSALDEVVQSYSMLLHEAVESFSEDEYEQYAAMSGPASAELATLCAELAASQAKVARLREALNPFAEAGKIISASIDDYHDLWSSINLTVGNLRNARNALAEIDGK